MKQSIELNVTPHPAVDSDERSFGIRIVQVGWATVNGGPDLVVSRREIEALAKAWSDERQREPHNIEDQVAYFATPYDGVDSAPRDEVEMLLKEHGIDPEKDPRPGMKQETLNPIEQTFDSLARVLVEFHGSVENILRPLDVEMIHDVIARCLSEAHPHPRDGRRHNFPVPAWDVIVERLEAELHNRQLVARLVVEHETEKMAREQAKIEEPE